MPLVESHTVAVNDGIHLLNPLEIEDWDDQLRTFPSATIFHTAAWARTLNQSYGYHPCYLVKTESGRFHSLIPLMEVNSWLTGCRGVSLPFTDECEPLCADIGSFRTLFEKIVEHSNPRRWKYWECRGGKGLFGEETISTSFLGHSLTLQNDETTLFAQLDSSVRRALRKAERSGLTIEFSQTSEAVKTFHGLLAKTRQRHGVPVQPLNFFENIQKHVLSSNQGWVVLARQGQVPVAGAVFFHFGKTVIYKYGASDESFQHVRANNLVMWHAIKWYARHEFTTLDFGRTSLGNEGLRRFKLGWGARERQIHYFRYNLRTARFVRAPDASSGRYNFVFKIIPIFLSRLVGSILYKHMA